MSESHSDLVLYLGAERGPVVALTHLDHPVTVVRSTGGRSSPEFDEAGVEVVEVRDHTRVDDVLEGLAAAGRRPEDHGIVCTEDEFAIVPAAVLDHRAGGRSNLDVPTAMALRNKLLQKESIRQAGIPTAACRLVHSLDDLPALDLRGPVVVKPPSGAGTQSTWIVEDLQDAAAASPDEQGGLSGPWLVEEFVTGTELHVDGVVRDGRVRVASVSRYLHNVIDIRHGRLVGSITVDQQASRPTVDLLTRSLHALGFSDGVFHCEFFEAPEGLVFGECAGRIGGGLIAETMAARFGVDMYAEWAAAAVGAPSPLAEEAIPPRDDAVYGWVNIPAPVGVLTRLPTAAQLEERPGIVVGQVWRTVGEDSPDPRSGSHLLTAKAMARGSSAEAVRGDLLDAARWFRTQTEVRAP